MQVVTVIGQVALGLFATVAALSMMLVAFLVWVWIWVKFVGSVIGMKEMADRVRREGPDAVIEPLRARDSLGSPGFEYVNAEEMLL